MSTRNSIIFLYIRSHVHLMSLYTDTTDTDTLLKIMQQTCMNTIKIIQWPFELRDFMTIAFDLRLIFSSPKWPIMCRMGR